MSNTEDHYDQPPALPKDAVAQILKHLVGSEKDYKSASKVCKTWNRASKDPGLLALRLAKYEKFQDKILKRLNKAIFLLNRTSGLTTIPIKYKRRLLNTLTVIKRQFEATSANYKIVRKSVKELKEHKKLAKQYESVGRKQKILSRA